MPTSARRVGAARARPEDDRGCDGDPRAVLLAFERAEFDGDPARARLLTFVVIGGGPTGVELAGAVAELARTRLPRDFRPSTRADAGDAGRDGGRACCHSRRTCRSGPREQLARLGVEVRLGGRSRPGREGVALGESGSRPHGDLGRRRHRVSGREWLERRARSRGRCRSTPDLTVPGHPLFVIGDTRAGRAPCPASRRRPSRWAPSRRAIHARSRGRATGRLQLSRPGQPGHHRPPGSLGRFRPWIQFRGFPAWVLWAVGARPVPYQLAQPLRRRDRLALELRLLRARRAPISRHRCPGEPQGTDPVGTCGGIRSYGVLVPDADVEIDLSPRCSSEARIPAVGGLGPQDGRGPAGSRLDRVRAKLRGALTAAERTAGRSLGAAADAADRRDPAWRSANVSARIRAA